MSTTLLSWLVSIALAWMILSAFYWLIVHKVLHDARQYRESRKLAEGEEE